ncbi:hypothetical protein [Noviherbaspirillum pedocola]|uniref:Lipoprotein n=1 Tax=Noviherbaspirillum pedocola TaxID=2801341 RepID=A0A934W7Y1_9BURK|nr:hypothetical protein [Noviherbaspirillum pedocola]MBK4736915.1 hypothetical protein [Noviherbaspirillum pedocola]
MHNKPFRAWATAFSLASTLAFYGCGGGGSDSNASSGSGSTPVTPTPSALTGITEAKHVNVSANAYVGAQSLLDAPEQSSDLLAGVTVGGDVFNAPRATISLLTLGLGGAAPLVSGVTQNVTCPGGGSAQLDATMSSSSQVKPGDTIAVSANDCVSGGARINGRMSIVVQQTSGTLSDGVLSMKLAVQYQGFTVALNSGSRNIDGDMLLTYQRDAAGALSYVISGNALSIAETDKSAQVVQRTLQGYSGTINSSGLNTTSTVQGRLSGQTAAAGQFSVDLKTLQPFVNDGSGNAPKSGVMLVSGAGSTVTMTAVDALNVRLDYSANGDGVTTKSTTVTWDALKKAI